MNELKFLDCFAGLGGASEGFAREGFDVTGIEIDSKIAKLYPYRVIVADMRDLKGEDFKGFDVVWGSPPCRDFSQMSFVGKGSLGKDGTKFAWKDPPDPQRGLILVRTFLKFVEEAHPRFWILENSNHLKRYLKIEPRQISNIQRTMKRGFWGNYPTFLMPMKNNSSLKYMIGGKLRSWERAKIPLACSSAFARACKEALVEEAFLHA